MDKDMRSGGQQQQQDTESGHGKQGFASMSKGTKAQGWAKEQMNNDLEAGFSGCLPLLAKAAAHNLFKERMAASESQFAWWDSETRGNWLWGYTMLAFMSDNSEHKCRAISMADDLVATADDDGYIGVYDRKWRYNHPPGESGELWAQSRALLILLTAYELTGDRKYLEAVKRATDLTLKHYGPHHPVYVLPEGECMDITGLTHGLNYVDVCMWLHRITGDERYREFGVWLYQDFNNLTVRFQNDDMTVKNILRPHAYFQGHAVHTAEHLRVLAWAAPMAPNEQWSKAFDAAVEMIAKNTSPAGGLIGDEGIHGLPLPDIGYEYCSLTELSYSWAIAAEHHGMARAREFADYAETIVLNAAQGARLSDGTGIGYLSRDTQLRATADMPDTYVWTRGEGQARFKISPTHEDVACCCNPNCGRLLPHHLSRAVMRAMLPDGEGLAILFYLPSVTEVAVGNGCITLAQDTSFPFSDTVTIRIMDVSAATPLPILLRIPGWAEGSRMAVTAPDGAAVLETDTRGWLMVDHMWAKGDEIQVKFTPRIEAKPSANGEVTVWRGPLMFVQGFDFAAETIKEYPNAPNPSLCDRDLTLKHYEDACKLALLDATQPDFGLVFKGHAANGQNWGAPGLSLEHKASLIELKPIGSTTLRRSTFLLKP